MPDIWGQDQNEEFKKIKKLQEKAIRIISFLPLNASYSWKTGVWNVYTKIIKDFIMLQNMLFVNDMAVNQSWTNTHYIGSGATSKNIKIKLPNDEEIQTLQLISKTTS